MMCGFNRVLRTIDAVAESPWGIKETWWSAMAGVNGITHAELRMLGSWGVDGVDGDGEDGVELDCAPGLGGGESRCK